TRSATRGSGRGCASARLASMAVNVTQRESFSCARLVLVASARAVNSVCSLPRLRGGVGRGWRARSIFVRAPPPVPPPHPGEGTMWRASVSTSQGAISERIARSGRAEGGCSTEHGPRACARLERAWNFAIQALIALPPEGEGTWHARLYQRVSQRAPGGLRPRRRPHSRCRI